MAKDRLLIDVMIPSNPLAALDLLTGVAEYSRQHTNWRISAWQPAEEAAIIRRISNSRADAALVFVQDKTTIRAARAWGQPIVNLLEYKVRPTMACVGIDDVAVGKIGAAHLIESGLTQLAFCVAPHRFAIEREEGFVAHAAAAGCRAVLLRVGKSDAQRLPSWEELHEGTLLRKWVTGLPKPIGIMACNDGHARQIVEICEDQRLRVPDDVAVLGADNNLLVCEFSPITMSSIDIGYSRLGHRAAELLNEQITGKPSSLKPILLPPVGLVVRRSTDRLAFADDDLRAAIQMIRDRATLGLTVDEVVDALSVSRRSLERKMREAIGRTPGEEIRRVRISRAMGMLIETEMRISEISVACGFEYLPHFTKAFRSAYGTTPTQYREHNRKRLGGIVGRKMITAHEGTEI